MHIGLLQADRHELIIEQQYGTYSTMFQQLFHPVDSTITFTTYQVINEHYPDSINECDAYLISGSKESVYNTLPWIAALRQFIIAVSQTDTKLIGICFGHQIIADALGGTVEKSKKGWAVGVTTSLVTETNAWMQPPLKQFSLLVSHQDQVTRLPDKATCISGDVFCPFSGFRIGQKILTFQGHPEFSINYLKQSMLKRRELFGDVRYHDALESLHKKTQHDEIARWILNFIKSD